MKGSRILELALKAARNKLKKASGEGSSTINRLLNSAPSRFPDVARGAAIKLAIFIKHKINKKRLTK